MTFTRESCPTICFVDTDYMLSVGIVDIRRCIVAGCPNTPHTDVDLWCKPSDRGHSCAGHAASRSLVALDPA